MNQNKDIFFSEEAIKNAIELQKSQPQWHKLPLRLYIEGKGCDGFYYGVSFDEAQAEDQRFPQVLAGQSIDLVVDPETLKFTTGSQIVWVDDERGKGFLVENPRHRKFRGKFFKRSNWEQKLGPNT